MDAQTVVTGKDMVAAEDNAIAICKTFSVLIPIGQQKTSQINTYKINSDISTERSSGGNCV